MDELREGDVGSSARDEAHSHHHSKSAHGLVAVALLAATGPWVLFGDEVVGQTVREITMAGAALAAHSAVALCLLAWAIQPHRVRKYDYWLVTAMTTLAILVALVCAVDIDHLAWYQLLESRALLRLATLHFAAINVASLLPKKAWVVSCVTAAPILLAHPLAYTLLPDSWDRAQGADGWLLYGSTVALTLGVVSTSLASSYTARAAFVAAHASQVALATQAARSQGLLETAMPTAVARALVSGLEPECITASFESASVAFIALAGFEDITARLPPRELLQWLNAVYESLDALVDAYGGAVTKIETVSNVYVIASGLPSRLPREQHARFLAEFCVDVLHVLQTGLPASVDPVSACVGLHVGPVTAGLIGRTRRYYRIFGDTVNVASRMMTTGEVGRVQASEAAARALVLPADEEDGGGAALLFAGGEGAVVDCGVASPSASAHSPLRVTSRGLTFVKGKGDVPTFWIDPVPTASHTSDTPPRVISPRDRPRRRSGSTSVSDAAAAAVSFSAAQGAPHSRPISRRDAWAPAAYMARATRSFYEGAGGGDSELLSPLPGSGGGSSSGSTPTNGAGAPHARPSRIRAAAAAAAIAHYDAGRVAVAVPDVHVATSATVAMAPGLPASHSERPALPETHVRRASAPSSQRGPRRSNASVAPLPLHPTTGPQLVLESSPQRPGERRVSLRHASPAAPGLGVVERVQMRAAARQQLGSSSPTPAPDASLFAIAVSGSGRGSPNFRRIGARGSDQHELPGVPASLSQSSSRTAAGLFPRSLTSPERTSDSLAESSSLSLRDSGRGVHQHLRVHTQPSRSSAQFLADALAARVSGRSSRTDSSRGNSPRFRASSDLLPPQVPLPALRLGSLSRGSRSALPDVSGGSSPAAGTTPTALAADFARHPLALIEEDAAHVAGVIVPRLSEAIVRAPRASLEPASPVSRLSSEGDAAEAAAMAGSRGEVRNRDGILVTAPSQDEFVLFVEADAPGRESAAGTLPQAIPHGTFPQAIPHRTLPQAIPPAASEAQPVATPWLLPQPLVRCIACFSPVRHAFQDTRMEREAQRELFYHALSGTSHSIALWCASWIGVAVINAALSPLLASTPQASAASMASTRLGLTLLPVCMSAAFVISARVAWMLRRQFSDTMIRLAFAATTVFHITVFASVTWFFLGTGPAAIVPYASAWGAGKSGDAEAGPFEGQLLLSFVLVAYLQAVAHTRLPFANTAVIACAAGALVIALAPPLMMVAEPSVSPRIAGVGTFAVILGVCSNAVLVAVAAYSWEARCRLELLTVAASKAAEEDSTRLLHNLMPPSVVAAITGGREVVPACASNVVILHGDIVGFTALASRLPPLELMAHLNAVFSAFDALVEARGLWKLETVGDAYIVAGGLFDKEVPAVSAPAFSRPAGALGATEDTTSSRGIDSPWGGDNAGNTFAVRARLDAAFSAALAMLEVLRKFREASGLDLQMRIGVHIGSVVHGVVGSESPRFCVLGEATVVAERTQARAAPGTISCSAAARAAYLASSYVFVPDAQAAGHASSSAAVLGFPSGAWSLLGGGQGPDTDEEGGAFTVYQMPARSGARPKAAVVPPSGGA